MDRDTAYTIGAIADIVEQKLLNSKFKDRIGKEFDSKDMEFVLFLNKAWEQATEEYHDI